MKEIINSIKKAEAEAEKIVADARSEASQIANDAELKVMTIESQLVEEIKNTKKSVALKSDLEAQELYDKRLDSARQEGNTLKQNALQNVDEAVDFILKKVLG